MRSRRSRRAGARRSRLSRESVRGVACAPHGTPHSRTGRDRRIMISSKSINHNKRRRGPSRVHRTALCAHRSHIQRAPRPAPLRSPARPGALRRLACILWAVLSQRHVNTQQESMESGQHMPHHTSHGPCPWLPHGTTLLASLILTKPRNETRWGGAGV